MLSKSARRTVFSSLSGTLAPPLLKVLSWSQNYEVENETNLTTLDQNEPNFILAFWHGQMLPVLFYFTHCSYDQSRFYTFISPHRDGEYITRAAAGLGINALRTSLRDRRLSALKEAIGIAREGHNLAVTPDGPIGPAFEAKQGIVQLSTKLELPILPVAGLPARGHYFDSWDHFCLPYPFSTIRIVFGDVLYPWRAPDTSGGIQSELTGVLNGLTEQAAEIMDDPQQYLSYRANAESDR